MAKKIDVSRDKFLANMMSYGNTSAASIPILLSENGEWDLKIRQRSNNSLIRFCGGFDMGQSYC